MEDHPHELSVAASHRIVCSPAVGLIDFAEHVWGVGKSIAFLIQMHTWELDAKELFAYEDTKDQATFLKMAKALLDGIHRLVYRGVLPQNHPEHKERCEAANHKAQPTAPLDAAADDSRKKRSRVEDDPIDDCYENKKTKVGEEDEDGLIDAENLPWDCFPCRSFYSIIGLRLQEFEIAVTYYDRFLELKVADIDFRNDIGELALVLYGTHLLEAQRSGVEPRVLEWSPYIPEGSQDMFFYGAALCPSHRAGYFPHIPIATLPDLKTYRPADSKFPEDVEKEVVGSFFALVQRGTGGEYHEQMFHIAELLQEPALYVGNSTVVHRLTPCHGDQVIHPVFANAHFDVTLKSSWAPCDTLGESDVFRVLNETLHEELMKHFPTFLAAWRFSPKRFGVFWTKLDLELNDSERKQMDCEMRVEMVEALKHWSEVDNIKELITVWLHCVRFHYYAWREGKVLHCDIDETNVMFYREANGAVVGVLIGWEHAMLTDELGRVISDSDSNIKKSRFMATDLLRSIMNEVTEPHLYRHDLEAFFHVLAYAVVHYDLKAKTRRPLDPLLNAWFEPDFDIQASLELRYRLFRDGLFTQAVRDLVKSVSPFACYMIIEPCYRQLYAKWKIDARAARNGQELGWDFSEEYDGLMTLQDFIKRTEGTWKPERWRWNI